MFEAYLRSQGLEPRGGHISVATLDPAPKHRNTRNDNADIKALKLPEGWVENANRLRQKDLDFRWGKENVINQYGYNNTFYIDDDHGFIRRYTVTHANDHDSQMLPHVLDPEN